MKTESKTELIDVLVVGGGPTGTALAIDLTRRGLAVRIIDKAAMLATRTRSREAIPVGTRCGLSSTLAIDVRTRKG
ncbi:FAD-dependent oxidoreductase [Nocardia asiatica]|uniref:FAD-dependent oxidoreductase n=1 Tax=Nocardia asiatica TaxID=209252 RepID=UPI003EE1F40B